MSDHSNNLIKDYTYWSIYIHADQGYLGRCIVWCKRENALDLSEATSEEQKELFDVLKDLKNAIAISFQPDWFNYAFLGNDTAHLHCHFIPRYAHAKSFMETTFEDKCWGHNYETDHDFAISDNVLRGIQATIQTALANPANESTHSQNE